MPKWECVRGASIGFVSHKTAGRAGKQLDFVASRKRHVSPNTF